MEIQFQHHHVLTFCDQNKKNFSHILFKFFKRDERDYPECCVCSEIVYDGPAYFCAICGDIWVHKFCAFLPREIPAHPLHLQHHHSLTLQTRKALLFNFEKYICERCRDIITVSNYYECSECGLKLDLKCALPPDNADLQQITALLSPDTKTQISHDSHRHTLFLSNSRSIKQWTSTSYICRLCEREIADLTYCCFSCHFYLHKRCVEITQQECAVQHPCHSHHSISIEYGCEKFICDQCRNLCSGFFMAICKECGFQIDFKCAFIKDITIQRSIGDEVKTQIRYFNHDLHLLSFFNYTSGINLECQGCRLPLSGPSYGCLECSLYLHKSCVELPRIIQHPYHPFHKLHLQATAREQCEACQRYTYGLSYHCYLCRSFFLDTQCAINNLGVISALKNKEYHQHDLYYFVAPSRLYDLKFQCDICSKNCDGSFYICLECKHRPYFHIECIGIPKEVKHDSHIHPLSLMDPLTEDEIDESKDQYYCYTCENKRNPRYHAYSCQQCANTGHIFTTHIECVLSSESNEIELNYMAKEDDEEGNNLEKVHNLCNRSISPRCMKQLLIKDKFNDHILKYLEDITSFSCYLCKELKKSPGYECSFCQIHLHEECAKLPSKIKHNLHEHPLSIQGGEFIKRFICDGCQVYHKSDMCYHCEECSFSLDTMCVQGIPSTGNPYRKLNDNGSKVGFSHFSHNHKLRFAFIPEKLKVNCSICRFLISGPTYCCYACHFFLHKSCFNELKPQYIHHPFHIQHPLHFTYRGVICNACTNYSEIGYECAEGHECAKGYFHFKLDIKCVKYLSSSLQHKCHEHKLFYFVAEDINGMNETFRCKMCKKGCNASFYRCLECHLNLHIECIPIPKNVKSVCHVHPLTLMDSITKEGQDEYYCHACESLRNSKHATYYCKKCHFTAHIGCVLDEEDGELEIL